MFSSLARFSYRRKWFVLAVFAVLFPLWGSSAAQPSMPSPRAASTTPAPSTYVLDTAEDELEGGTADIIALYTAPDGKTIDDPEVRDAITAAVARAEQDPDVRRAATYWDTNSPTSSRPTAPGRLPLSASTATRRRSTTLERLEPELAASDVRTQFGATSPSSRK
jgi:RND superfamily putative drug exporter